MTAESRRARGALVLVVAFAIPLIALATWTLGGDNAAAGTDKPKQTLKTSPTPSSSGDPKTMDFMAGLSGDPAPPPDSIPPDDRTLKLSVPAMKRVDDIPVTTASTDDAAVLDNGALHARGTGFPWEAGANVYIAGHRIGYPGTDSYLLFLDLDKLVAGDSVLLTDAKGTLYEYRVYDSFRVSPNRVSVMKPLPGNKPILSLQTCTLPDYEDRLIVRAELVDETGA